jgi:hypothetical protein
MRGMIRIVATQWAAAVITFCALAMQAYAAEPAQVEDLIRRGTELRKKGEDAKALPLYQRAYELAGTPRAAAQLGLVETQLGYRLEAEAHLSEALAARKELWINKYRSVLESTLRDVKTGIGEVVVLGSPAGAEVTVNGRARGRLPIDAPVRVSAGPTRVELRAAGYTDASATIIVQGQTLERVTLNLAPVVLKERIAPPEPPAPKRPGSMIGESVNPAAQTSNVRGLRTAAWSSAALALALVGGGAVEMAVASGRLDEFRRTRASIDTTQSCGTDQLQYGGGRCLTLHDEWSRARTLGLVGIVGGGLLAATSATLFVLSTGSNGDHRLACAPVFRGVGVSCGRWF